MLFNKDNCNYRYIDNYMEKYNLTAIDMYIIDNYKIPIERVIDVSILLSLKNTEYNSEELSANELFDKIMTDLINEEIEDKIEEKNRDKIIEIGDKLIDSIDSIENDNILFNEYQKLFIKWYSK